MEQPQSGNLPTLESNNDQLLQELHQLATHIKQPDQHQQHDDSHGGQAQHYFETGR